MHSVLSDKIKANKDLWLVGDTFLRDVWPAILGTNTKVTAQKTSKLYIFDNYNIVPCFSGRTTFTRSILVHLHNQIISTLNDQEMLPKFIVVLPDKDIIEAVKQAGFGL